MYKELVGQAEPCLVYSPENIVNLCSELPGDYALKMTLVLVKFQSPTFRRKQYLQTNHQNNQKKIRSNLCSKICEDMQFG